MPKPTNKDIALEAERKKEEDMALWVLRRNILIDKSCRILKIAAAGLENSGLGDFMALAGWLCSALGDLSRLTCNVCQRSLAKKAVHLKLGSIWAICFRVIKSLLSLARLALHVLYHFFSTVVTASLSAIGMAVPILNICSALGNFINDTIKLCKQTVRSVSDIAFYSGKTLGSALMIAGCIIGLVAIFIPPLLPVIGTIGTGLFIAGVVAYTTFSISKAALDLKKTSSVSLFKQTKADTALADPLMDCAKA
jgi:hypothetical protein